MSVAIRKPTAARREEIIAAVLRIIGEQGITQLNTATLARELELSSGALFRHFPSLDALLEATTEVAIARLEETFPDPALPPRERLAQLATRRVELLGNDKGLAWLLRSEQALLTLPTPAVTTLRQVVERSQHCLLTALEEAMATGAIRQDIAPPVLQVLVSGVIHALIGLRGVHGRASGTVPTTPEVLDALWTLLDPSNSVQTRSQGDPL